MGLVKKFLTALFAATGLILFLMSGNASASHGRGTDLEVSVNASGVATIRATWRLTGSQCATVNVTTSNILVTVTPGSLTTSGVFATGSGSATTVAVNGVCVQKVGSLLSVFSGTATVNLTTYSGSPTAFKFYHSGSAKVSNILNSGSSSWAAEAAVKYSLGSVSGTPVLQSTVPLGVNPNFQFSQVLNFSHPNDETVKLFTRCCNLNGPDYAQSPDWLTDAAGNVWTTTTPAEITDGTLRVPVSKMTNLVSGSYFQIKVRAIAATGEYSEYDYIMTPTTNTPPSVSRTENSVTTPLTGASNLTYTITNGSALTVGGFSATDTAGQTVTFTIPGAPSWATLTTTAGNPASASLSFAPTNAAPGVYAFSLVATDNDSTLPISTSPTITITIPAVPTLTPGDTDITATWAAPTVPQGSSVASYKLRWREVGTANWTEITRNPRSTTRTETITGLVNGTEYEAQFATEVYDGTNYTWSGWSLTSDPVAPGVLQTVTFGAQADQGNGASFVPDASASPSGIDVLFTSTTTAKCTVAQDGRTVTAVGVGTCTLSARAPAGTANGVYFRASASVTQNITITASTVPPAPVITGITAGNGQISVAFTISGNGGAALTNFEYKLDSGAWVALNPAVTSSPLVITGLANGTQYSIQIRARNSVGPSVASNSMNATPQTVPSAPVITGVTAGDGELSIAFTVASNGGSALTNIEYQLDSGAWIALNPADTTSPIVITGLSNGTQYAVQIRAVNGVGSSNSSNSMNGTPVTNPSNVSITGATAGDAQVSVAFTVASDGGTPVTNVEYSIDGGQTWVTPNPAVTTSPIVITGLTNGTQYAIKVRAVNAVGPSLESNQTNATPQTVPTAPVITGITVGSGQLSVAFTVASDGGSALTNIEYSLDSGAWVSLNPAGTTSPIVISGLTNGTTYSVRIRAVNGVGNSQPSNADSAMPQGSPTAPLNVVARAGFVRVFVSWDAPTSNGGSAITGYLVTATPGGATCTAPAGTLMCEVYPLNPGTTYTFTVAALNVLGTGASSAASDGVSPAPIYIEPPKPPSNPEPPTNDKVTPVPAPVPVRPDLPEPVLVNGAPPSVAPGNSAGFENGEPIPVVINRVDTDSWTIRGDGFNVELNISGTPQLPSSAPLAGTSGAVTLVTNNAVEVSGVGFGAGTWVDVWLFPAGGVSALAEPDTRIAMAGKPIYLGQVLTKSDGTFEGALVVPQNVPLGSHTLQVAGKAPDGVTRSLNLGVQVVPEVKPRLPITGHDPSVALMAVLFVLLGSVVLVLRRRRPVSI